MKEKTKRVGTFIHVTIVALLLAGASVALFNIVAIASDHGILAQPKHIAVLYRSAALVPMIDSFTETLATHGWNEGKNVTIDRYLSYDDMALLDFQAGEVVKKKYDLIVAIGGPTAEATMKKTSTIPIVFYTIQNPITEGLIKEYHSSANNLVGVGGVDIQSRQIEILEEFHQLQNGLGVLGFNEQTSNASRDAIMAAAQADNVTVINESIASSADVARAFDDLAGKGVTTVYMTSGPTGDRFLSEMAQAAIDHRMILFGGTRTAPQSGVLASVNVDIEKIGMQFADDADRILHGTAPKDISSLLPDKSFVAVNKKTAAAIGVTIPQGILSQADFVAE